MKFAILAILMATALAITIPSFAYRNADIDQSIVALRDAEGSIVCSGVVINRIERLVLTADHCLARGDVIIDGIVAPEIAHLPEFDVSVLKAIGMNRPALPAQFDTPLNGLDVAEAIGFAEGFEELTRIKLTMVLGVITVEGIPGKWLLASPYVIPGMSGGPLLNVKGEIVAICQQSTAQYNISIQRPITELKGTILEQYFEGRPAWVEPIPEPPPPFTDEF